MNNKILEAAEKINALSLRERLMVFVTIIVLTGFAWWNLYALPVSNQSKELDRQNGTLEIEIQTLNATSAAIQKRIKEGVHKTKQQKLTLLRNELRKVKELLNKKTQALIEPNEMFDLMQQLLFAESRLKLTGMKRKSVEPVFKNEQSETAQPQVYRHVLQASFEGKYNHILKYIQKMENLQWMLIWDRITLETTEYPLIGVTIEISTLSDNRNWVGL